MVIIILMVKPRRKKGEEQDKTMKLLKAQPQIWEWARLIYTIYMVTQGLQCLTWSLICKRQPEFSIHHRMIKEKSLDCVRLRNVRAEFPREFTIFLSCKTRPTMMKTHSRDREEEQSLEDWRRTSRRRKAYSRAFNATIGLQVYQMQRSTLYQTKTKMPCTNQEQNS